MTRHRWHRITRHLWNTDTTRACGQYWCNRRGRHLSMMKPFLRRTGIEGFDFRFWRRAYKIVKGGRRSPTYNRRSPTYVGLKSLTGDYPWSIFCALPRSNQHKIVFFAATTVIIIVIKYKIQRIYMIRHIPLCRIKNYIFSINHFSILRRSFM